MAQKDRVLIIDDDIEICNSFCEWLTDKKYIAESAITGGEGLEKIKTQGCDVVILDIKIPDMGGIEILRQAREIIPDTPIIILTGYASIESAIEAVRYGAYDYISKPANMDKLDIILRRAIQHKELEAENKKMIEELRIKNEQLSVYKEELEKMVADTKDELKITREQLLKAERLSALAEFASGFCHEIANPITIISGTLQCLMKDNAKIDAGSPEIKSIASEIERCSSLIEKIRSFTEVSETKLISVNINILLTEIIDFMKYRLKESNISVDKRFSLELPEITAPKDKLKEVFINLILNAQHAMPKGGTITIESKSYNDGKGIIIEFGDTGRGIPKEIIDKIFDPFFTIRREGMGLGLSISSSIITRIGGSIDVESKEGQGTTFTIKLPVESAVNV